MFAPRGLRPLESVQCFLCKEYGHYANDPRCSLRNRMPMPSSFHQSAPMFSPPSMHYFSSSPPSSSSNSTIDASLVQFRDGVTVFDALMNLMADNIALKKELSELRQRLSSITLHPASSSVVVPNASSSSSSSSSTLPSSASRHPSPPRSSFSSFIPPSLAEIDVEEKNAMQEFIAMTTDPSDVPQLLGPLHSAKKKNKKKNNRRK